MTGIGGSLKGLKVAMLHYSNSIIDLDKLFGMQMMEMGELGLLKRAGIEATLSAKEVVGSHEQLRSVSHRETDKLLLDIPYYQRFLEANPDAHLYQGNATPILALFNHSKTIIRLDGFVPLDLVEKPSVRNIYGKTNFIFVSKSLKNRYLNKYDFLDPKRCHVLYNAVNYRPTPIKKKNEKFKILFCSRWSYEKGIEVLFAALTILQRFRKDYEVHVAGGMHKVSSLDCRMVLREEKIYEKASKLKNLNILGYVPHDKLTDMYSEFDLVVLPSIYPEPFGLIAAEAAISCVPTLAFSIGALPEVVDQNKTGILLPYCRRNLINCLKLAKEINILINKREELIEMGLEARERALRLFNWENYQKKLFEIYDFVLNCP